MEQEREIREARFARAWAFVQKEVEAAEGSFGTKAAKKAVLESIGRAWEYGPYGAVHAKLLAVEHEQRGEAWRKLYYGFPAAHVWKEKHAAVYAAYPEEVKLAGEIAALRAKVVAMEVVKKPKPKTAAQLKKEAQAKTCQICARKIFAEVGVIAHHGYERPGWGYQTPSCWGARHLPFEVSREELGAYIVKAQEQLGRMVQAKRKVQFEEVPLWLEYSVEVPSEKKQWGRQGEYVEVRFEMTRANAVEKLALHKKKGGWQSPGIELPYVLEEELFEYYKKRELENRAAEIRQLKEHIEWQEGRYAAWVKLMEWKEGKWVKI